MVVGDHQNSKFGLLALRAEPESFHMSYWASLEIEMSLR